MADNETSYLPIGTCLEQIEKAVYGREVRKAIHDGIAQCYDDTVEGVNAAQQAASDTQDVIDNAVIATREANTAAAEASNVKVEQTVSGDTVTFTTTKRDGTTVSTSFQKPNVVVSKDEGSGEFSVTGVGWNGEEIIATIPDPSEEVKSRATIAAVSKVKTALGNPLTITDGMDAPAVKTVVTLEPKQDLHGYDHPWVGGAGKNLCPTPATNSGGSNGVTYVVNSDGSITLTGTADRATGITFSKPFMVKAGVNYILSGCPSGGGTSSYRLDLRTNETTLYSPTGTTQVVDNGVAEQFTPQEDATIIVATRVASGYTFPSGGVTFYPMVISATETDRAYAPYSNICPIEGYDTVRVTATGKNLAVKAPASLDTNIYNATNLIPVKAGETIYVYALFTSNATTNMQGKIFSTKDVISKTANVVKDLGTFISGKAGSFAITNDGYFGVTYYAGVSSYTIDKMIISREPIVNPDEFADPNTTSLSVAQAAGATVYGGTVTLNEDGSGTLVVDRGIEVITKDSPIGKGTKDSVWYLNKTIPMAKLLDYRKSLICDTVEVRQNHVVMTNAMYNVPGVTGYGDSDNGYPNSNWIYFTDGVSTTKADIVAWLTDHPLSVVYPLRTPTTYTLTADQLRTITGKNHVWTDGTKLELTYRADKYADVEKFLNAIPTGTKTGDPAVFADGADDLPFEKLTIAVEPHQEGSGDPSPDNVRPITGWDEVKVTRCGKNLFPGIIAKRTLDDTTGEETSTTSNSITTYIPAVYNTVYVLTPATGTASGAVRIFEYDKNLSFLGCSQVPGFTINSRLIINPANANTKYIRLRAGSGVLVPDVDYQLEEGSNSTVYEPYTSTSLPISLKYATGSTVYSGTVTINRDGTGSVVVDKQYLKGSECIWSVNGSNANTFNGQHRYALSVANDTTGYSSAYVMYNSNEVAQHDYGFAHANAGKTLYVKDKDYSDLESFKTHIADVEFVYKLATPITYALTAPQLTSLFGNNTVLCDAGQVTVKYKRDIGKMISNLYALMINTGVIVIENEEDVTVEAAG